MLYYTYHNNLDRYVLSSTKSCPWLFRRWSGALVTIAVWIFTIKRRTEDESRLLVAGLIRAICWRRLYYNISNMGLAALDAISSWSPRNGFILFIIILLFAALNRRRKKKNCELSARCITVIYLHRACSWQFSIRPTWRRYRGGAN